MSTTFTRFLTKFSLCIIPIFYVAIKSANAQACTNDTAIITAPITLNGTTAGALPNCGTVIVRAAISITGDYTSPTGIRNFVIDQTGSINFVGNGNISLVLPANTVFRVISNGAATQNQVTATQCNNQKTIFIGGLQFANCNGSNAGGQNRYSFDELVTFGGSAAVNPTYTPLCTGGTLTLQANLTGGSPTQRVVTWTGPAGVTFSPSNTSPNPIVTPATPGDYTATATDGFTPGYSQQRTISVVVAPQLTFTTQPTPADVTVPLNTAGPTYTIATTGGVAPVTYQWYQNTTNSTVGATAISGATGVSYTPPTNAPNITYYFCTATPSGAGCAPVNSNIVRLAILDIKTWTGAVSTDWNTPGNWSPTSLPGSGSDVIIPPVTNQPTLASDVIVKDVDLQAGSTITLNGFSFTANGPFTCQGTIAGSPTSSLYLRGQSNTTTLNFSTASTASSTLKNLYISGNSNTTLGTPLLIDADNGTIDLEGNARLFTGGFLILGSSAAGSAYVGNLADNGSGLIVGDVTVERHFTGNYGRKWRLITAPVTGSTNNSIFANWQNNGVSSTTRGVEIWAPNNIVGWSTPVDNPTGYASGPNPGSYSIRAIDNVSGAMLNIASTKDAGSLFEANGPKPFFLFPTSPFQNGSGRINFTSGAESGILAAKGGLVQGNKTYNFTATSANKTFFVPNPYAARVNFAALEKSNLLDRFWVWDPQLTGTFGVGAYQLVDLSTGTVTPGGGSYPGGFSSVIESGQSFFVETDTDGAVTLQFLEASKVAGPEVRKLTANSNGRNEWFRVKVNLVDPAANNSVYDGILAQFEKNGNSAIDGGDALKFTNSGENISIPRSGNDLLLERRPLPNGEEILPIRLWRTRQTSYRLLVDPVKPAYGTEVTAKLEDTYLQKTVDLAADQQTAYDFTVNSDVASTGNRFRVLVNQSKLIFNFADASAQPLDYEIALNWNVTNEFFQKNYTVERSRDGQNFAPVQDVTALNNGKTGTYTIADSRPLKGKSYYRIKTVDEDGLVTYSPVIESKVGGPVTMQPRKGIRMYPNPVSGNQTGIEFADMPAGNYTITILGQNGRQLGTRTVSHSGTNQTYTISLPMGLRTGKYEMRISSVNGAAPQSINFIKE